MMRLEETISGLAKRFAEELDQAAGTDSILRAAVLQMGVRECALALAEAFPDDLPDLEDMLGAMSDAVRDALLGTTNLSDLRSRLAKGSLDRPAPHQPG